MLILLLLLLGCCLNYGEMGVAARRRRLHTTVIMVYYAGCRRVRRGIMNSTRASIIVAGTVVRSGPVVDDLAKILKHNTKG